MALVLKDRVKQTTTTTGTGSIVLNGNIDSFQTFAAALTDGDTTYYGIFEPSTNEYEIGLGTWTESSATLARTTVLESSNSGSAVSLTAQAEVFITQPAEKSVFLDANGSIPATAGALLDSEVTNLAQVKAFDETDYVSVTGDSMSGDLDMAGNKVLFGNVYSTTGDLPSASTYHGMFAHVHGTGKGYFAHAGNWVELANQADVTAAVNALVDSAPGTLDTLNELAAALGDDANFSTTVTNSIATKLPLSGGAMTGAITTNSTFDGRDVATDGAKLDGIESGATADQTNAEIRAAVEAASDSNVFTDADHTKLNGIATSANNYTHPSHPGDDINIDTGALSGATVISDLDFNITTDTLGHVTDANATVSTRNITLANLGYTGATNANYITNNNQLSNGAGYTTYTANQSLDTTSNPTFNNVYNNGWFRNYSSGEGLYNEATGQHWYSDGDDYWNIAGGGTANGIRFRDEYNGTTRGYVYADSANQIGFLDSDNNWAIKHVRDSRTEFYINSTEYMQLDSSGLYVYEGSIREDYDALSGTSPTCDLSSAAAFSLSMSGNTTFTFSNATSGMSNGFILQLTGNGSTVTWPSSVKWAGGTAPDAPASGETDVLVFHSRDGGSNWYGVLSSDAAA